ncbi:hypothetical protein CEXT_795361 [Caerostris extrusa]|uniref:Uncharacterized protein n=1 Tax=Caerostris extrusa TaxID=172846 RepID=A0AAV4XSD2_CAEEX|nr:hypothetical protein CEXT_795361 [Caerostris extrusa]
MFVDVDVFAHKNTSTEEFTPSVFQVPNGKSFRSTDSFVSSTGIRKKTLVGRRIRFPKFGNSKQYPALLPRLFHKSAKNPT